MAPGASAALVELPINLEPYTATYATTTIKTQFEDAAKLKAPLDKIDVDEFKTYDLSMGRSDDAAQRATDFRSADVNFDGYLDLAEAQAHEKMWRQFFFGDRTPAAGTATWFDYKGGQGTVARDGFLLPKELIQKIPTVIDAKTGLPNPLPVKAATIKNGLDSTSAFEATNELIIVPQIVNPCKANTG